MKRILLPSFSRQSPILIFFLLYYPDEKMRILFMFLRVTTGCSDKSSPIHCLGKDNNFFPLMITTKAFDISGLFKSASHKPS